MSAPPRDRRGFQVAIICALPLEAENVRSVFDACWEDQNLHYGKAVGDQNSYSTGVIGKYNVVLVHMSNIGSNSAAVAAAGLRSSFQSIRLALVVGICGVVPVHPTTKENIVLGDIVISTAVIQYDFGRQYPSGFRRKDNVEDSLGRANPEVRSFIKMLGVAQNRQRFNKKLEKLVQSSEFGNEVSAAAYPGIVHDRLYQASYVHQHRPDETCDKCLPDLGTCLKDCDELGCENSELIVRSRHVLGTDGYRECETWAPVIHFGRFGSANTVMRSGLERDRISAADEVTGFEMEGAGIWEQYPTVVIKAACDYSDSHKNKIWQAYAAAMAAACSKVFLEEWIAQEQPLEQDKLFEPIYHIPFDPVPGFIGRGNELQELEQRLFDSSSRRIVSLLGLGGIGKSRLALEIAYQTKLRRPQHSVFWIQASESLTLENDMLEIGKRLGIPGISDKMADVKALVKQKLSLTSTEKWLLILDNADDEALWGRRSNPSEQAPSLVDYLPKTTNGSILITTRARRVATSLAGKEVIKLGAIPQDEAADMFVSKLEDPDSVEDRSLLLTLANRLANLPLAIVQAASYINMTEISIQTYIDLMNQPEAEVVKLLSKDYGDDSRYPDATNPVVETWLISFKQIQERHPLAARFLSAMACLREKGIPLSLLPEVDSKVDTIEALGVLIGYSFVTKQSRAGDTRDNEELYDIHRLVHLAARNWLKREGTFSQWVKDCTTKALQVFPTVDSEQRTLRAMCMPHVMRVCEENGTENLDKKYELLERIGLCFLADGKYDEAVQTQTVVLSWRQQTLSTPSHLVMHSHLFLGQALGHQGNYSKAEDHLTKAVNWFVATYGKSDPWSLQSMRNLAEILVYQGLFTEAEKMLHETLQLAETVLGKSHFLTLNTMEHLAQTIGRQGKFVQAEEMHRQVLLLNETTTDKSREITMNTHSNLAAVLGEQAKYTEAEAMYRDLLQWQEASLGRNHPRSLTIRQNLAWMLHEQDKGIEAEEMQYEVLHLRETVLGKNHPSTLSSKGNLAKMLSKRNKHNEALEIYHELLPTSELVLGKKHPQTLTTKHNLASLLYRQRKHVEAEEMCREVLCLRMEVLGKSHPSTLATTHNLASILTGQGRFEEAVELLSSCSELILTILGPAHPQTQATLNVLAECRNRINLTNPSMDAETESESVDHNHSEGNKNGDDQISGTITG